AVGVHLPVGDSRRPARDGSRPVHDHAVDQPGDRPDCDIHREATTMKRPARAKLARTLRSVCMVVVGLFSAPPLSSQGVAPLDGAPSMSVRCPDWTLNSFRTLLDNPYALRSIGNSLLLAGGTMALTVVTGTLASYALSRVRIPGRNALLYGLLLLSSIVTGT